jgi:hypothetical protein
MRIAEDHIPVVELGEVSDGLQDLSVAIELVDVRLQKEDPIETGVSSHTACQNGPRMMTSKAQLAPVNLRVLLRAARHRELKVAVENHLCHQTRNPS